LLLDAKDPAVAKEALGPLKVLYEKRSPIEQKGLKGKLKILAMTSRDKGLREETQKTLEGL
jgi:hypothetical protein